MTTNSNNTAHYTNTAFGDGGFKGWLKAAGNKPGEAELAVAHAFAKRPGKQTLAHALALRPEGVSGSDIVLICGAQQLNHMRGLIDAKWFTRDMNAPRNAKGQAVYKLTLTPKGEAELAKRQVKASEAVTGDKPAKATKGKGKATKPRKGKGKPAPAPVVEPVSDPAPQAPVTSEPVSEQPPAQA